MSQANDWYYYSGGIVAGAVGSTAAGAAGIGLLPTALGAFGFGSTGVIAGEIKQINQPAHESNLDGENR